MLKVDKGPGAMAVSYHLVITILRQGVVACKRKGQPQGLPRQITGYTATEASRGKVRTCLSNCPAAKRVGDDGLPLSGVIHKVTGVVLR